MLGEHHDCLKTFPAGPLVALKASNASKRIVVDNIMDVKTLKNIHPELRQFA